MTCSGTRRQVPIAGSSAGSIVPAEHAHAWCAKHAFWEDPARQCAHMRAYLRGYYSARRDVHNVHATARSWWDMGAEISEVIFSSFPLVWSINSDP